MDKKTVQAKLTTIANEAADSDCREVKCTAGILYALLGALAVEGHIEELFNVTSNFTRDMLPQLRGEHTPPSTLQ